MAFDFRKKFIAKATANNVPPSSGSSQTSGWTFKKLDTPAKKVAEIYIGVDFGTTFTKVSFQVG